MFTRIALVVLIGLLALPIAQTASPVGAKQRPRTITRTFRNPATITIPTSAVGSVVASPYPIAIEVRGLKGSIRDVNLTLNDVHHSHPDEIEVLLVGPRGQTAIVMARVGHYEDVTAVTLRLDDEAAAPLPAYEKLQSGAFRPTNVTRDSPLVFNAPAPSAGQNSALSIFDGSDPNGTWQLFVQDAFASANDGAFAGGWALEITAQVKAKKKRR